MAAPQVNSLVLAVPGDAEPGKLIMVAIAITYAPELGVSGPDPGAAVVAITPAEPGWDVVLSDLNARNFLGDFGSGDEADRLAVFTRLASAAEPASYTFNFTDGPVSAAGAIKCFQTALDSYPPNVTQAAAAAIVTPNAGNPMDVEAPQLAATEAGLLLVCFFVARNGGAPAPGGTAFTVPPGMHDLSPAINLRTNVTPADPLGLAIFAEILAADGDTGTRTSTCDQNNAPPNPFTGMGYSCLLAGCILPEIPLPPPS